MPKNIDAPLFETDNTEKAKKPLITKTQLKNLGKGAAIGVLTGFAVIGAVVVIATAIGIQDTEAE